jgi:hypothetical protein
MITIDWIRQTFARLVRDGAGPDVTQLRRVLIAVQDLLDQAPGSVDAATAKRLALAYGRHLVDQAMRLEERGGAPTAVVAALSRQLAVYEDLFPDEAESVLGCAVARGECFNEYVAQGLV